MILTSRQQAILDTLVDHGRERLHEDFRRDCCIAATAIVCDCLDWAGFNVRPFPVQAQVANKAAMVYLETYGEFPDPNKGGNWRENWDACRAHLIGIGFGAREGARPGYDGHLIAVAHASHGEGRLLIDLTLDQCDRPHRDLCLPPLVTQCTTDQLLSPQMRFDTEAGDTVLYYPRRERVDYQTSPDWTNAGAPARDRIVGDLIRLARNKERELVLT